MALKPTLAGLFIGASLCVVAQTSAIIVPKNTVLPKDSVAAQQLLSALNGFLAEKEKPNKDNAYVWSEELPATSILLDQVKGIEKSRLYNDTAFFKAYLINAVKLSDKSYRIQLAYMGAHENVPVLRISLDLIATKKDGRFYFSSPLKHNTALWKSKTIGAITFHYKHKLNDEMASAYEKKKEEFTVKLKAKPERTEFYYCDDLPEAMQVLGISYKSNYNGYATGGLGGRENNELVLVNGQPDSDAYDPHDLWHSRLRSVLSQSITNRPVDEGCAYLYGGSWGISWPQIMKLFKEKVASDPKADWLALYEAAYDFSDNKEKDLVVSYVINALLVEKIEKEKGFPAVMELLSCGKLEKDNENYFKALEKLTGINKQNFNEQV